MKKRILSIALALFMVVGMLPTAALATTSAPSIQLTYDDRYDVSGYTTVVITDSGTPTSKKVGTDTADTAVITHVGNQLIATGVGEATVELDGTTYTVEVTPAKISLIMVTGHSLGAGQAGSDNGSVVCEDGQAYSTRKGTSLGSNMGLGYSASSRPSGIDALIESGDGVQGNDSAIAYRWHELTGEKIWVLNAGVGGSNLDTWKKGGSNYNAAVNLFKGATTILANEVAAGHYTLNKMGIVNHTTANGDQTWEIAAYESAFLSMWNGFKTDLEKDIDGDGTTETVDCIGLLPIWNVCAMNDWTNMKETPLAFNNGKLVNYDMAAYSESDVVMASVAGRKWVTDAGVAAYFTANSITGFYDKIQSGATVTNPTTMQNGVYGDGVHYNQLGYNVTGYEAIESMHEYWYGTNTVSSVKLLQQDGTTEVPETITLGVGDTYAVVPEIVPSSAKLSYETSGTGFTYDNCLITATAEGYGTLTIKNGDVVLKTVNVNVGAAASGGSSYIWNFENGSMTSTLGENTIASESVGTYSVDSGVLSSSNDVFKLSEGITIDPAKNWCVEVTMAAHEGATTTGNLLNVTKTLGDMSIWVPINGNMTLTKKIGGSYCWWMVSNEDWKANFPANYDPTDMHTYRLVNTEGTISYWLDGKKIGDLTSYRIGASAPEGQVPATGTYAVNYEPFTVNYIGANNSNYSWKYNAKMDALKIFENSPLIQFVGMDASPVAPIVAYPGETVTMPTAEAGGYNRVFKGWTLDPSGSGTLYAAGDTYTVSGTQNVTFYAQWEEPDGFLVAASGDHFTMVPEEGNATLVEKGGSFSFTVDLEDGYKAMDNFAVMANGTALTAVNGVYTIENIQEAMVITVVGIGDALDEALRNTVELRTEAGVTSNVALTVSNGTAVAGTNGGVKVTTGKLQMAQNASFKMTNDWTIQFTYDRDAEAGKPVLVDTSGKVQSTTGNTSIWVCTNGEIRITYRTSNNFRWYGTKELSLPTDYNPDDGTHTYIIKNANGVISYSIDGVDCGVINAYSIGGSSRDNYSMYDGAPNFDFNIGYVGGENKVTSADWWLYGTVSNVKLYEGTYVAPPSSYNVSASGEHFTLNPEEGYANTVEPGGEFKFTITIADNYQASEDFAIKVNGNVVTADSNGIYTIANIMADQVITAETIEAVPEKALEMLSSLLYVINENGESASVAMTVDNRNDGVDWAGTIANYGRIDVTTSGDVTKLIAKDIRLKMNETQRFAADKSWAIEANLESFEKTFVLASDTPGISESSVSIWIGKEGDMYVVQNKGAFFWYMTENAPENFDSSVPHNFRLVHSPDGTYTYYLDGEKVGDLTHFNISGGRASRLSALLPDGPVAWATSSIGNAAPENRDFSANYLGAKNNEGIGNWYLSCTLSKTEVVPVTAEVSFALGGTATMAPINTRVDGTGKNVNLYVGDTVVLPGTAVRDGYQFKYWSLTPDGEAITQVTLETSAVTVYANWNIITYQISYDGLAGAAIDTNPAQYTVESESFTLNNPTKDGYVFMGWTGTDLDEAVENVTVAKGSFGDRTYTATWERAAYNTTLVGDCVTATDTVGNKKATHGEEWSTKLTAAAGYALPDSITVKVGNAELILNTDYSYNSSTGIVKVNANKVVDEITVSVTVKTADGIKYTVEHYLADLAGESYTKQEDDTQILYGTTNNSTDAKANVYTGFTAEAVTQKTIASDGTTVVRINYTRNQYNVSYQTNGASVDVEVPAAALQYYGATVTVAEALSKTGYTFTGWTAPDGVVVSENTFTMPAKAVEFTGTWTANAYTVQFDKNGGEGSMDDMAMTYGVGAELTANTFTAPSGKYFGGWATSAEGAVIYADCATVKNLTAESGATVTLYAVWVSKPVPVIEILPSSTELTGGGIVTFTVTEHPEGIDCEITCDVDGIEVVNKSVTLPNETKEYTFTARYPSTNVYEITSDTCVVNVTFLSETPETPETPDDYYYWVPTYPVTTPVVAENGAVSVNTANAVPGSTVTVAVTADKGYELAQLVITDTWGNAVAVTKISGSVYAFTMPASKVTITATFEESKETLPVVNTGAHPFTDVPTGQWYSAGVQYVYTYGIMNGVDAAGTRFDLNGTTSRAMLMTMLARMSGVDTSTGATWDAVGMAWAKANGISDGTNGSAPITREQLVTMLWRYAGEPDVSISSLAAMSAYPDATGVSSWAQKPMAWAIANGIITNADGKLLPGGTASRAMVATILMRFCENIK